MDMKSRKSKKPAPLYVHLAPEMREAVEQMSREDAAASGDPSVVSRWIRQLILAEIRRRKTPLSG